MHKQAYLGETYKKLAILYFGIVLWYGIRFSFFSKLILKTLKIFQKILLILA